MDTLGSPSEEHPASALPASLLASLTEKQWRRIHTFSQLATYLHTAELTSQRTVLKHLWSPAHLTPALSLPVLALPVNR